MQNKNKIIGLAVLTLLLTAGISTALAGNEVSNFNSETRKAEMEQIREARQAQMRSIFENGTYGEWVAQENQNFNEQVARMQTRHQEMLGQITEENYGQFAEAHLLMMNGDFDGAKAIFDELGINRSFGLMDGYSRGMGEGRGNGFGNRKGTVDNS
ncbi:MAG: hypothetical protein V1851_02555 [Patescibacteria group bacterium]